MALERATTELDAIFQSDLRGWDSIPHARRALVRLARNESVYPPGVNAGQVKKAIDELMADGVILRVGHGRYTFHEPMFQAYLVVADG